jgi:hypothetical protein
MAEQVLMRDTRSCDMSPGSHWIPLSCWQSWWGPWLGLAWSAVGCGQTIDPLLDFAAAAEECQKRSKQNLGQNVEKEQHYL